MLRGRTPLRRRVSVTLALIFASAVLTGAGASPAAGAQPHQGHVPEWVPLIVSPSSGPAHVLRVEVMVDDTLAASLGDGWMDETRHIVGGASPLLAQVDVLLDIVTVRRWHPQPGTGLEDMLASLLDEDPPPEDVAVLALTGRHIEARRAHYDGWSSATAPAAIVEVAGGDDKRTDALIAHELAHVLGAEHHGDGHVCLEGGCLMDAVGFAHGSRWCGEHADIIAGLLAGA